MKNSKTEEKQIQQPYQFAFHDRVYNKAPESRIWNIIISKGAEGLNREEKNEIFHKLQSNSGKTDYRLLGWVFPFKQFMRKYLVKYNYDMHQYHEIYAFDKTCIRSSYYIHSGIIEILEIKSK